MAKIKPEGIVQSDPQVKLIEAIVKQAYLDIFQHIQAGKDSQSVKVKIKGLEKIVAEYDLDLQSWADVSIPGLYKEGMDNAVKEAIKNNIQYTFEDSFATFHQKTIELLVQNAYQYTSKVSAGLKQAGVSAITAEQAEKVAIQVARGEIDGSDIETIARNVEKELKTSSLSAITYKSGKNVSVDGYARTLARSVLTQAQVQAIENTHTQEGYDLVQVSDHFGECALCVLPDTKVITKDLFSTTAIQYSGDVITIRTASGNELTGTPDHTVLTDKGWLPLKALSKGDNVISDNGIGDWLSSVGPNEINVEARIDEIGKSIRPFNLASPTSSKFNNNVAYRKINIVNADLFLLRKVDTGSSKALRKIFFIKAMRLLPLFLGGSNSKFALKSVVRSFPFLLGWLYHSFFFFWGSVFPSFFHRITPFFVKQFWIHSIKSRLESMVPRSGLNSIIAKIVRYTAAGNGKEGTKLIARLSGLVKSDKILSLSVSKFSGHVYDLENKDNWYLSNNIISHNCRPWENEVLSLTGRTKGYSTLNTAKSNGLFHSNCRHSVSPYFEGLASVSKVWDTKTQSYQPKELVQAQNWVRQKGIKDSEKTVIKEAKKYIGEKEAEILARVAKGEKMEDLFSAGFTQGDLIKANQRMSGLSLLADYDNAELAKDYSLSNRIVGVILESKESTIIPYQKPMAERFNKDLALRDRPKISVPEAKTILKAYEQFTTKIGIKQYNNINDAIKNGDKVKLKQIIAKENNPEIRNSLNRILKYLE